MKFRTLFTIALLMPIVILIAQEQPASSKWKNGVSKELIYTSSWAGNFRLRSDGWQIGGEYSKSKNYFKKIIYQFDLGLYKHPKQVKQNKDPYSGWFNNNGIKPFNYGKQNTLIALHIAMGQKFLLAEKAKKNGVMINYYYAGGVTLGILKPYFLRVCADDRCTYYEVVGYDPQVNNKFTDYDYIIGAAGFGVGWKLKLKPGLHFKTGMEFDWSNNVNMIKAVDIGLSVDTYIGKVPIMVSEKNKFLFLNAYVGISLGKKK